MGPQPHAHVAEHADGHGEGGESLLQRDARRPEHSALAGEAGGAARGQPDLGDERHAHWELLAVQQVDARQQADVAQRGAAHARGAREVGRVQRVAQQLEVVTLEQRDRQVHRQLQALMELIGEQQVRIEPVGQEVAQLLVAQLQGEDAPVEVEQERRAEAPSGQRVARAFQRDTAVLSRGGLDGNGVESASERVVVGVRSHRGQKQAQDGESGG